MLPTAIARFDLLRWPAPFARLDPSSRPFALALSLSIAIHAVVLSIHFKFPDGRKPASPNTLDVIFVNSKTKSKPLKQEALAQANLDGGGNTDLDRRAKTPLPFVQNVDSGQDTKQALRRVQELEAKQRELLAQTRAQDAIPNEPAKPQTDQQQKASGVDLAQSALAIARLEAQLSRSLDEYNKRPRKQFVGARATEYRFAQYVEDWRQKIERIGNLNYPDSARGRVYGSLRLSVSISSDGSLASLEMERSSGHEMLDRAAQRIVQMAAPFARFPENIRRDTDILVITRTWHFVPGDKVIAE